MGHIAVVVDARRSWGEELLVVHGGLNTDKQSLGDLAVLQVDSEAWFHPQTTNAGPPARVFHSAAADGSYLYIFGGHAYQKEGKGVHKYNDLWRLNTDNWEWLEICGSGAGLPPGESQPCMRDFAGMLALPGSRLLVFGGLDVAAKRLDDLWIFDCSTSKWTELVLPSRPKPRFGFAMARLDQNVLLFGGENAAGALMNDVWLLKGVVGGEEKPSWQLLEVPGDGPSPRKAHTMAALGRYMIVFGGHASEAGWFRSRTVLYHNDVTVLDRAGSPQWRVPTVEGDIPAPREFHTLTPLSPTRLLLFGGGDGKTIFSDTKYLCLEDDGPSPQGRTLMEPGQRAHSGGRGMPGRALSVMSGLSENTTAPADQRLLSKGSTVDTIPDPATSVSPALQTLRERLGLGPPEGPALGDWQASGRAAFQELGLGLAAGARANPIEDPLLLRDATRVFIAGRAAQELRLKDVAALLWDLQSSSTPGLDPSTDSLAALEVALQQRANDPSYRYRHLQAKDLRIGEIKSLHASYTLFVSQQLSRGSGGEFLQTVSREVA